MVCAMNLTVKMLSSVRFKVLNKWVSISPYTTCYKILLSRSTIIIVLVNKINALHN